MTLSGHRRGTQRYAATLYGRVQFCYVHGGRPEDLFRRTKLGKLATWVHAGGCPGKCGRTCEGSVEDRWFYQHEDVVYEVLGQLRAENCPFAPGWQGRTNLGDPRRRRIDPDAMILVGTPWGRRWCYLEVELSDRTYRAVEPRCNKYGSMDRRDDLPVLIVCRDEQAEENFHSAAAASESPFRLLTTTLARLMRGGIFGPGVWSDYGRPVTLAR